MEPITAALVATVAGLAQRGLNLLANALLSKGKAVVEDRLGVSIDDMLATPEGIEELRKLELDNFRTLTEFTPPSTSTRWSWSGPGYQTWHRHAQCKSKRCARMISSPSGSRITSLPSGPSGPWCTFSV